MAVDPKVKSPQEMARSANSQEADQREVANLRMGERLTPEEMAVRRLRAKARLKGEAAPEITPEMIAEEQARQAAGLPAAQKPTVIRTKPPLVHTKRRCEQCEWREESLLTGGTYCMDGEFTVPETARKDANGLTVCCNERFSDE